MILYKGQILEDEQLDVVMGELWDSCVEAVSNRVEIAEQVICACGRVSEKIKAGEYDNILWVLFEKGVVTRAQLEDAIAFFNEGNLRLKYETELGALRKSEECDAHSAKLGIVKRYEPLGILFHIAAGNAEGLPFFSVIEGLLAGNVNILKLPSMDDGISVMLLHELIKEAPELAPYICVLDVASTNVKILKQLADMADAVVVWGGDEAVLAARAMATPATQIISWGHKLSFAYVGASALACLMSETSIAKLEQLDVVKEQLRDLAHHICETKQLLCSSCQGIFVDSEEEAGVLAFAEKFLHILEEASVDYPQEKIGPRGKVSISLYNEELESKETGRKVLRGKGVSVIASRDSELELSYMFKNCWVKPLPRKNIVKALKSKKGYLQTVGLICAEEERAEFTELFIKAGVTHVAGPKNMSKMLPGGTHDGEYPLRRYSKVVEMYI